MRSSLAVPVVVRYLGKLTTYTEAWLLNAATIQFAAGPGFVDQADLVLDEIALYPHKITDAEVLTLAQRQISDPVAAADTVSAAEGATTALQVLANDTYTGPRSRSRPRSAAAALATTSPSLPPAGRPRRSSTTTRSATWRSIPVQRLPDYRRDRHIGACDRHRHGDCRRGGAVQRQLLPDQWPIERRSLHDGRSGHGRERRSGRPAHPDRARARPWWRLQRSRPDAELHASRDERKPDRRQAARRPRHGHHQLRELEPRRRLDTAGDQGSLFQRRQHRHRGQQPRATRCQFRQINKYAVQVFNALDTRVDHCDFSDYQSATAVAKGCVEIDNASVGNNTLKRLLIDYCHIHAIRQDVNVETPPTSSSWAAAPNTTGTRR